MKQANKVIQKAIGILLIISVISILIWVKKENVSILTRGTEAVDSSTESIPSKPNENLGKSTQHLTENTIQTTSSVVTEPVKNDTPALISNTEINSLPQNDNAALKKDNKTQNISDLPEHVMRWREIVSHFDDLYSASKVREIRNRYLDEYCKISLKASHAENRQDLKEGRDAAKAILAEGTKELEQVYEAYTKTDDNAQYEALLAIGELLSKNEDCNKAIVSCEQALKGLNKDRLKAQAHYYISVCSAKLQKSNDADMHMKTIMTDYPKEAKQIYYRQSAKTLESLMRNVAFYYENAEKLHFMVYQATTGDNAQKLIELRDKTLALADRLCDSAIMGKGGMIMGN
jgi:tetratricopeptide (TPR) repeat protein